MIHFTDCMFYESSEDTGSEFREIFHKNMYDWVGHFGSSIDNMFGVCDDPRNPTWGVFGKEVRNFPHSQLFFRSLFQVRLVYGKVDLSVVEKTLDGKFDFILSNEFGLKIPNSVDLLDEIHEVYPLPNRYRLSVPSRVDSSC